MAPAIGCGVPRQCGSVAGRDQVVGKKKMFYLLLFFYVDGQPIADDGCVMGLSRLSVTCLQRAGRVKYQRRQ